MTRGVDLVGQRFGRLLVIRKGERSSYGAQRWECKCDCGNVSSPTTGSLTSKGRKGNGGARSCGCLHKEQNSTYTRSHGKSKTRTYRAWADMIQRCRRLDLYVRQGIQVNARWADSFENFWIDMGDCPEGLTLDRIKGSQGYDPWNCRWASSKEQRLNTTNIKTLTLNGVTKPRSVWCEELGLPYSRVRMRKDKLGWTDEEALLGKDATHA